MPSAPLKAGLSVGGGLWDLKQLPGVLRDKFVVAETRRQRFSVAPFGDGRLVFTPEPLLVSIDISGVHFV